MNNRVVELNEKKYTISKLPLGRYSELLEALDKLPTILSSLDSVSQEKIIEQLPRLAKDALPELIKMISIGSGIDEQTLLGEMGLFELAELFTTIWEVNEFDRLGKVIGRIRQQAVKIPKTGLN